MNVARGLRLAICILLVHAMGGCRDRRPPGPAELTTVNEHGVRTGDIIAPFAVQCTDGVRRIIGGASEVQLVTISAESDCSECELHITGLDALYRARRIPIDAFVVTYMPRSLRADVLAAYHARTAMPICIDSGAVLWHQTRVSHTPVTVLLKGGRISYVDDSPLNSPLQVYTLTRAIAQESR